MNPIPFPESNAVIERREDLLVSAIPGILVADKNFKLRRYLLDRAAIRPTPLMYAENRIDTNRKIFVPRFSGAISVLDQGCRLASCWELSPLDLEQVHRTKRIWLIVDYPNMPPLAITTVTPIVPEELCDQ